MRTKKGINRTIWILICTLLFTGAAIAAMQNPSNPASSQTSTSSQQKTDVPMIRAAWFFTVRDIMSSEVRAMASTSSEQNKNAASENRNENAEKLGTVKDVVINNSQNCIEYVVIDSDRKLYPVPWTAFNFSEIEKTSAQSADANMTRSENEGKTANQKEKLNLYLDMNKTELQKAPVISSVSAEKFSEPTKKQDIDQFYSSYMKKNPGRTSRTETTSATRASSTTNMNLVSASKIFELKLQDSSGTELKKIENVVAEAPQGQLLYALVNFGGILEIGEKTAAVPWQLVTINEKEGNAKINAEREKLDAAEIKPNEWYKLEQPQFARQIYSNFGVQPSAIYGFVPGEMTEESFSAWKTDSTYNKNFDNDKMTTVKGTVRSTSTYEPAKGAAPGIELTVEASDGKTYTIFAGPQEYAKINDFTCKSGDEVEIKGSTARINDKSVVIASEIKNGTKTLDLYNSDGKPLWNTEELMK